MDQELKIVWDFLIVREKRKSVKNKIMDLTRTGAHYTIHNSNGLLYRYGNKSRRKVVHVLVLLAILLMPLTCDGEEKIIRVDPLGRFYGFSVHLNVHNLSKSSPLRENSLNSFYAPFVNLYCSGPCLCIEIYSSTCL